MAYGNKVKFHYDIPVYIKKQLAETAKELNMTATALLSELIEQEYDRVNGNGKPKEQD